MKEYRNEVWKKFEIEKLNNEQEILVSNYGRVKKRKTDQPEFKLYKNGIINNFETFAYKNKNNKNRNYYVHRAVAQLFLEKPEGGRFVIHLNHDLKDNFYQNLKWVNQKELTIHQNTNPKRIAKKGLKTSAKLTVGKVTVIKKKLLDPNRKTRLRIIASQFGISEQQLRRIKSGENWGEIKV